MRFKLNFSVMGVCYLLMRNSTIRDSRRTIALQIIIFFKVQE